MKKKISILLCLLLLLPLNLQPAFAARTSSHHVKTVKFNRNKKKQKTNKTKRKYKKAKKSKSSQKINKSWIKTISKNSYVTLNRNTHFYSSKNHQLKNKAKKKAGFRIYYVRFGKQIYYANKSKKWLRATDTHGSVRYRTGNNIMIITTNKKGRVTYSSYTPVSATTLRVKHNAYVYNNRGMLNKGTVKVIKKGQRVKAYSLHVLNGKKFYLTNYGWLKAANLTKTKKW